MLTTHQPHLSRSPHDFKTKLGFDFVFRYAGGGGWGWGGGLYFFQMCISNGQWWLNRLRGT